MFNNPPFNNQMPAEDELAQIERNINLLAERHRQLMRNMTVPEPLPAKDSILIALAHDLGHLEGLSQQLIESNRSLKRRVKEQEEKLKGYASVIAQRDGWADRAHRAEAKVDDYKAAANRKRAIQRKAPKKEAK